MSKLRGLRGLPLWLSLALHAIAFTIPFPSPPQPSKTSDLKPVWLVQLPPQSRSSPLSVPQPQPAQPSLTFSDARSSNSSSSASPSVPSSSNDGKQSVVNQSLVTKKLEKPPAKQAETTSPQPEPSQTTPASRTPQPSVTEPPDSQTAQIEFQAFITAVKTGDTFTSYSLLEILKLFGQPGQMELFFNQQAEQKPGILEFQVFPDKSSEQVIQEVVQMELGDRQGFTLQEQQSYGTSNMFAATKHGFTRYVHVVPLNARSGSLLVIWDRPPAIAIQ